MKFIKASDFFAVFPLKFSIFGLTADPEEAQNQNLFLNISSNNVQSATKQIVAK
jgi:hypothetical protein